MDHFMEEVVVKHNRGVENALYILSNIVMVLSALWALMCIQMLFMQFSIYGLIEALVTAGVAVLLFCAAIVCAPSTSIPSPTAIWILPRYSTTRSAKRSAPCA